MLPPSFTSPSRSTVIASGDQAMAKKRPSSAAANSVNSAAPFPWSTSTLTPSTATAIALFALLIRAIVSLGSYSGGSTPPKYGDYEAQRHWMEITLHTPAADWYRNTSDNDLAYWGLDYPPLSAYQSLAHAVLINASLPDALALRSSRGFESPQSKLLMRWTVLLSDALIFFPAAIAFVVAYYRGSCGAGGGGSSQPWLLAMVLMNPALILIDHGHFQYNCISLGLTLGAIAAVISGRELVGSALFTLAINHKQMSMYFAPAFFSHLLGKCLKRRNRIFEVMKLGFVVLGTFAIVWWPYLHSLEAAVEVLSRLAPFERGIYEDYVANFWCSTSVLIKWKRLFTVQPLRLLSLATTITACLPSFIQQLKAPSVLGFLYALLNSSFSFYLFSYQVHEKSILLPLLPASLLAQQEPLLFGWLTYYALLSMYPLLCRDCLLLQYTGVLALSGFLFYSSSRSQSMGGNSYLRNKTMLTVPLLLSLALHFIYLTLQPPEKYPFLFEALIVLLCFSQFVFLTFYTNIRQWMLDYSVRTGVAKKDL